MALVCTSVAREAAINCANPPSAGLENFAYIINKSDISSYTVAVDGSITAINLISGGARAWKYTVGNNTLNSLYAQKSAGIINAFGHTGTLIYPADAQDDIEEIANLANSQVVMVVNKRGSDGTGTFRLLGKEQGLVSTSIEGDDSNIERSGLPSVTLATDERFYETKPPVHVFDSSYAATLAMLEALRTPTA